MGLPTPSGVHLSTPNPVSGAFKGHDSASSGRYAPSVPIGSEAANRRCRNGLGLNRQAESPLAGTDFGPKRAHGMPIGPATCPGNGHSIGDCGSHVVLRSKDDMRLGFGY